jgi:hypothetical protein
MGDLKSPWMEQGKNPMDAPGLEGDSIVSRGTDPNIDTAGSGALQTPYNKPGTTAPDGQESGNSVSGLPSLPNRYEPSDTPPEMPTLKDRQPGTIDKK